MDNKYYFKNDTKLTNYYMCNVKSESIILYIKRKNVRKKY